jgi:Domain of unknown function (DUF1707)
MASGVQPRYAVPASRGEEERVTTEPGDQRAGHMDREQVIEVLKEAFVHGRLTKDQLDVRAGQALTARTYADLAALTADIPAAAEPARPPAQARRRPLARAAVAAGISLLIAVAAIAAMWVASIADPGGPDPAWAGPLVALVVGGIWTAIGIMGCAVVTSWDQKSSRGQLPPQQPRGGRKLEGGRPGSTGRDPAPLRACTDQTRADLRTHRPGRDRQHPSGRDLRAPRGARPIPDPV